LTRTEDYSEPLLTLFEASYEDDEPSLQVEVIDVHCIHEFRSKFN